MKNKNLKNRIAALVLAVNTLFAAGCTSNNENVDEKETKNTFTIESVLDEETGETKYVVFTENGKTVSIEEDKIEEILDYVDEEVKKIVNADDVANSIESIQTLDSQLTTERFEEIVAGYAQQHMNAGIDSLTVEDFTKFVSIVLIDELAEENPQLAEELFSTQKKEEYLNDAAKVIGANVMYDFELWNKNKSTDGFIKVSSILDGRQKDQVVKIEEYVEDVADAVNAKDKNLTNELIAELILELNSGSLSKLDDGVGFASQIYIAFIKDGIAKNYINKENRDMMKILSTSEKYASNIFAVYEECNANADTKTLVK